MDGLALPFALLLTFAIVLLSAAALRAWRQWLDLKRAEITHGDGRRAGAEIGELRRRVRRLEALACGIDL